MKKIILAGLAGLFVLGVAFYGALFWQNNKAASPPAPHDIATSRERSVSWLLANRETIMRDENPILWWMIAESAELANDSRLRELFAEFRRRTYDPNSPSIWEVFFEPSRYWGANVLPSQYANAVDYQQYFLFSLTCSKAMSELPIIDAQHDPQFCRKSHPISPACATHQLMGYRFMQRTRCDRVDGLDERIAQSQQQIEAQLTWDPRVVDVYIQRVLMLVDSGAAGQVKPRWLQRVLAAQLDDGSWSGLQPLVPLGGGRYLGFDAKAIRVGRLQGNLHATAQGLWLTSLLQKQGAAITADRQVAH